IQNSRDIETHTYRLTKGIQRMPQITLDLVSLDSKPLVGLSRRFEGAGGTIGRDAGNTLALPDSHRRVSRLHASITFPDGVPTITNSSAVLPIGVGGME